MLKRRSIRFRITAIAAAAAAAVLVVGGGVLVVLQRVALTATIDQALAQRADDLTALLLESPALPEAFAGSAQEGFSQLVSVDGEVLVSTPNLAGSAALAIDVGPGSRATVQTVTGLDVDDDAFRVLTRRLEGLGMLHVGTTYDVVSESATALTASLAATIPPLVLALAGLVWWLVGRTLRPVEGIRAQVAEIGSTDLHRRVPRPGTDDEIDRLAGTMNQMLARLEAAVKRQQRFVADASHE
ncbi:MAG: HAMP domain-containing protein, partial [Acidimicrobiia bacterium]